MSAAKLHASAMLAVNLYLTRYLLRLYQAFDGDLSEAMVLGEIAHHNVSGMLAEVGGLSQLHEAVERADQPARLPAHQRVLHRPGHGHPAPDGPAKIGRWSNGDGSATPRWW